MTSPYKKMVTDISEEQKSMTMITNSGRVLCVAKLLVGAGRNIRSVKIAGAHKDCTTGGHYYTCHNCDSE